MIYKRPEIEELAANLGIKPKILEADIRDLAWLWEATMWDMDLHSPLSALDVIAAIVRAYIRGRNCRMGNYQTLWKHLPVKAAMIYYLAKYVSEDNAPGKAYVCFPHLCACGVTSVDDFLSAAHRLSVERNRKQEEERQKHKTEAREKKQSQDNILDKIRRLVDGDERR